MRQVKKVVYIDREIDQKSKKTFVLKEREKERREGSKNHFLMERNSGGEIKKQIRKKWHKVM